MEFRILKYFLAVVREENITRAAQYLHITQPTLSRQLMQLEEELGVKLFARSNHSIILTDEGMLLKRRAEEILELYNKTKDELSNNHQNLSGTMPKIINTFLETYDMSGKTIMPFCTSGSSDISSSILEIKTLCPNSTVTPGFRGTASTTETQIQNWLDTNNFSHVVKK